MDSITTTLRYVEGSSDKQYSVSIQPSGEGYDVVAAWGRTGSTMQTAVKTAAPVPFAKAEAVADKLLGDKRRKGYTDEASGIAFTGAQHAGRDTGFRTQLLEPVVQDQAELLLTDPKWVLQEKYDGERRLVILEPGEKVYGANRNGLRVALHGDLAMVCEYRFKNVSGMTVLDGEDFGATFAPFDLLMLNGSDLRALPYSKRLKKLEALIADAPEFPRPLTYSSSQDKREAYVRLREGGSEGVVFKHADASYIAGRNGKSSTQFKDKFCESASCRVVGRNGDKRSIALELLDDATGQWVGVGNCTIPANFAIPQPGEYVEVRYLYAMPNGGCLVQPVYQGVRTDVDEGSCTLRQLKYKLTT